MDGYVNHAHWTLHYTLNRWPLEGLRRNWGQEISVLRRVIYINIYKQAKSDDEMTKLEASKLTSGLLGMALQSMKWFMIGLAIEPTKHWVKQQNRLVAM